MSATEDTPRRAGSVSLHPSRRPFYLTIDSGAPDEPAPRRFASLTAARAALHEYDSRFQRFAWITETRADGSSVTHLRDGAPV